MHIVDLRSDTVTKPTPEMRRAMAEAEVGDDVFGEDPTVNRLQAMAAERMGKEAALFVASGTMGNLVCLLAQCGRGDEVIVGDQAHTLINEQGGMAALGGIQPRAVPNQPDGTLDLGQVRAAIRSDNDHYPRTRLVAVENTHNGCGGAVLTPDYMSALGNLVRDARLRLHVDGARIFNASVALGVDVRSLVMDADSVTFCISKGLGAPVGSLVCGDTAFVAEARRARKVVGGGMRQAGVLAAAGIVALEQMVDRLAEDHANARLLAEGLAQLPWLQVEPVAVRTNILYLRILREDLKARRVASLLEAQGVRTLALGPRRLRAVTNYHVTSGDIAFALSVFRSLQW
jgi:threonine aldolase